MVNIPLKVSDIVKSTLTDGFKIWYTMPIQPIVYMGIYFGLEITK